ncbi:hypothetical protein MICAF_2380025 [Microcystis aeruginosa PCC 9807]|uniref:Uncharacterized protein n=1 Tax=Microcystis aeruginosa PCC 9807 TaxID=1160283 RepID=I4H4M5_MICAE|nr:hypothetical protein MICAF_2380025 [Microcystis aeruginosa PCC 9807]
MVTRDFFSSFVLARVSWFLGSAGLEKDYLDGQDLTVEVFTILYSRACKLHSV